MNRIIIIVAVTAAIILITYVLKLGRWKKRK